MCSASHHIRFKCVGGNVFRTFTQRCWPLDAPVQESVDMFGDHMDCTGDRKDFRPMIASPGDHPELLSTKSGKPPA